MDIPTEFKLGGSTIKVEVVTNLMETGSQAWVSMPISTIRISDTDCGIKCSDDFIESCLYHEVVHAILRTMGKLELNKDEEFVEGFGNLLHQYMKTKVHGSNNMPKM